MAWQYKAGTFEPLFRRHFALNSKGFWQITVIATRRTFETPGYGYKWTGIQEFLPPMLLIASETVRANQTLNNVVREMSFTLSFFDDLFNQDNRFRFQAGSLYYCALRVG